MLERTKRNAGSKVKKRYSILSHLSTTRCASAAANNFLNKTYIGGKGNNNLSSYHRFNIDRRLSAQQNLHIQKLNSILTPFTERRQSAFVFGSSNKL